MGDSKLTGKRARFVDAYFECNMNATAAARKVGYKHPRRYGSFLTKLDIVKDEIARRLHEKAMPADEVIARLSDMASGDIGDLLGPSGMVIDLQTAKEKGLTRLVKSLNWTKSGLKVEMYDAQSALNTLARAHGLLKEQHEMSGEITVKYVNDWRGPVSDD